MSTQMFGIKNCDTVKKARKWLDDQGIDYEFIDLKVAPLANDTLEHWIQTLGTDTVINKRGTTWRKLPDELKGPLSLAETIQLMQANRSVIKRPVLVHQTQLLVGFNPDIWQDVFA